MIRNTPICSLIAVAKNSDENKTSKSKYYVKKTFWLILFPITFLFNSFVVLFSELFKFFRGFCTSAKSSKTKLIKSEDVPEYLTKEKIMNPENPFELQRHYHRKAFDLISKALIIDEENLGKCDVNKLLISP